MTINPGPGRADGVYARASNGPTFGFMLYDRVTGRSTARGEHLRFRSASLVKLLIALHHLRTNPRRASAPNASAPNGTGLSGEGLSGTGPSGEGPNGTGPSGIDPSGIGPEGIGLSGTGLSGNGTGLSGDGPDGIGPSGTGLGGGGVGGLVGAMLRGSDDEAAKVLWRLNGMDAVVAATAAEIGLADTVPPADPVWWGYTATSAADTVQIYRYLLERAEAPIRDRVMGHLRAATRIAADGWDQFFGIPSAVPRPFAVKQGWSGFEDARPSRAEGLDTGGVAMHTSGTYGEGDRWVLAVLSLSPAGTPWEESARRLTALVAELCRDAPS
ncbi:hypothetical protein [Actinomadura yumaensis]|uniref:Serine hydrolase n=1 Tax=Actinomadura yumaensis TaxID=111807 RepID=A0ABW2D1C3_9ACTN